MILIFAEKPDAARDISAALNTKEEKKDGYIKGDNFWVTWGYGHLVELFMPEDYSQELKSWSLDTLPILPDLFKYKIKKGAEKQFRVVKNLFLSEDVDYIINAGDADREGELIFRLIYKLSGSKKEVKRAWLLSLVEKDIVTSFNNLKPSTEYDSLYSAAEARQIADFLIGINFTRLYTTLYKEKLTIGRVQTPLLAEIIRKEEEISDFVPKEFYKLNGNFENVLVPFFLGTESRFFDKNEFDKIYEKIKKINTGIITEYLITEKTTKTPLLYDLATLQKKCASKYGFKASYTLSLIQNLYETHKVLTYPRTDCRYLPISFKENFFSTAQTLLKDLTYQIDSSKITSIKLNPTVFNDSKVTAHHAIIPTGKSIENLNLKSDEIKVYRLVADSVFMQFLGDYRYEETKVTIKNTSLPEDYSFKLIGNKPIELGFKVLADSKPETTEIPNSWILGKELDLINVEITNDFTNPPSSYTESSIIEFMEKAGLGTSATRASILDKLFDVDYLTTQNKKILPTEKGIKMIEVVDKTIADTTYTASMENKLAQIAEGKTDKESFIEAVKKYVSLIISVSEKTDISFEKDSLGDCPICGSKVEEHAKLFACESDKCSYKIWKNDKYLATLKVKPTEVFVRNLLNDGFVEAKITTKYGKKHATKLKYEKNGQYFSWKMLV